VYFVARRARIRDLERELSRRDDARLVGASIHVEADRVEADAVRLVSDAHGDGGDGARVTRTRCTIPEAGPGIAELQAAGLRVRELLDYYEGEFKKVPLSELSPTWFLFESGSAAAPRRLAPSPARLRAHVRDRDAALSLPFLLTQGIR